MSDAIV